MQGLAGCSQGAGGKNATNPIFGLSTIKHAWTFLYREWLFMYIGSYSCSSPSAASRLLLGGKRGWEAGTHTLLHGPGTGPQNGGARGWWWVHTTQERRMRAAQHTVAASQRMAAQVAADSSSRRKFRFTHSMYEESVILSIPCSGAGCPLTPASLGVA